MAQNYTLKLQVTDHVIDKPDVILVDLQYDTSMLDEIASTLRSFAKVLDNEAQKRDKGRYKVIWEKPVCE